MGSGQKHATVLLSGGQDSATCLAWALDRFEVVYALGFDYGQRHRIEIELAQQLCKKANVNYHCISLDFIKKLGKNALTDHKAPIITQQNGLPSTFVPGRNLLFLGTAAAWAYQHQCYDLITGVCQSDFSGYPDCRENFIDSMENSLHLAMDADFKIHCPLMQLSKADSVRLMQDLGKLDWYALTHTCYEGQRPPCGRCPACLLRQKGFDEAGIADPIKSIDYNP
eukprot:COSAG01_NODE_2312_length_7938_cov_4.108687_4_plen_225_part_00